MKLQELDSQELKEINGGGISLISGSGSLLSLSGDASNGDRSSSSTLRILEGISLDFLTRLFSNFTL